MKYVRVPKEVTIDEITGEASCFSPGRFVRFIPPHKLEGSEFVTLDKLVTLRSTKIKARESNAYHYAEIGDINVYTGDIAFRPLRGWQLPTTRPASAKKGDILISTVRTYRMGVGLVTESCSNLVTTNALLNLCGVTSYKAHIDLPYVYAFLRTPFFTEQVWALLNRGMYPRMDTGALDKIYIPITKSEVVSRYLSAVVQACSRKEASMRERAIQLNVMIQKELELNQKPTHFNFSYPTIADIAQESRFDAVIYDEEYKKNIWLVDNYLHGWQTPNESGFKITPGPSLEIKILRTRIDSNTPKSGFYSLILPMNISDHGTMDLIAFLGTAKKLPLLKKGDIVFGEAGFKKGRSIVLLSEIEKCTTNAHGLYARREDRDIIESVFFRCIFNWYRANRLIDIMAVGGSGGHFSPEYFDYVHIPKFPDTERQRIVNCYHADAPKPDTPLTVNNFIAWHDEWNVNLGIFELKREADILRLEAKRLTDGIIRGEIPNVPIPNSVGGA